MAKMGRPQKQLDMDKLARVCQYPMTNEDIAAILDVSCDKISRELKKTYGKTMTFEEYKRQKQSSLRFTLLAKQIDVAKSGNVAMLIFLGKQYLGQSDKAEVSQRTVVSGVIDILDVVEDNK